MREAKLIRRGQVIRGDEVELVRDIMEWRDQKKMWSGRHCREYDKRYNTTCKIYFKLTEISLRSFAVTFFRSSSESLSRSPSFRCSFAFSDKGFLRSVREEY